MDAPGTKISFLQFLPVSLFGAIMGLTGLSFAWGRAEAMWRLPGVIKDVIGVIAIVLFLVLSLVYACKIWKYPALVKAEFGHPVSISFFATFIISLLLLPGLLLPYAPDLAVGIWSAGAVLMFLFAWIVLRKWLSGPQQPADALPAWILPVVGTLDVPIVGYRLPVPGIHEICLLFFGIGLIFGIIILTIIISRLLFQAPLPEALQPTLLILIGPFALAFADYESLSGVQDIAASAFYYFDLFLLLLLGSRIWLLPACCPFRVTWWAVSFPLTAITLAAFRYGANKHSPVFRIVPAILLTVATITILYLFIQTFYRLFTHKFLLPRPAAEKATETLQPAAFMDLKNAGK